MSAMPDTDEAKLAQVQRLYLHEFLHLVSGFWRHPSGGSAWLLTFTIFAVAVVEIIVQIGINSWNGWFFDILATREHGKLGYATLVFIGLALVAIGVAVLGVLCRLLLQVRWRQWLTSEMLDLWLSDYRYLRLLAIGNDGNNPEHRIAEDIRLSTEPVTDFVTGLITALLTSAAFLGLLWTLGGEITIPGIAISIPGYMVYAVLLYSLLAWLFTIVIGGGYVSLVKDRNEAEAKLRYELIHLREKASMIKVVASPARQRAAVTRALVGVAHAWTRVAHRAAQMTWISYGNTIIAPVVPLLLVAPKYLAEEMSLGTVMQVALAFVQVQVALNWFVANYVRLAEWYASVVRVVALEEALHELPDYDGPGGGTRAGTSAGTGGLV
jgi:putative ATP-binding cassette transporter